MKAAQAGGEHWGPAVKSCLEALLPLPEGANFGLVYVTEAFGGDLSSIVTFLRETTPLSDWLGAVGYAVLGPGGPVADRGQIVMLAGRFDEDALRPIPAFDDAGAFLAEHGAWMGRQHGLVGLIHADARDPRLAERLDRLAAASSAFLIGGLAAAARTPCHISGRARDSGLSGMLFGDGVTLATGLSQGCQRLGEVHRITEAQGSIVMGLDGRTALDVLKEEAGEIIARRLERAAGYIHVALPVEGSDLDDYAVRGLMAIDPERGWLAVGTPVETGGKLLFVRRDPNAAQADMRRMVEDLAKRVGKARIQGGIYISCVGRGAELFGRAEAEWAMIREGLGEFPLVGFSAGGEICRDRLYGFTGVLALFL